MGSMDRGYAFVSSVDYGDEEREGICGAQLRKFGDGTPIPEYKCATCGKDVKNEPRYSCPVCGTINLRRRTLGETKAYWEGMRAALVLVQSWLEPLPVVGPIAEMKYRVGLRLKEIKRELRKYD